MSDDLQKIWPTDTGVWLDEDAWAERDGVIGPYYDETVPQALADALAEFADCIKVINDKDQTSDTWGPRLEKAYENARKTLASWGALKNE